MSRRHKRSAHANHERWLVSYADFITLLFAFFVVLYSSAQVDQRKVGRLALAIQVAFQELGVFPASTTQIPLNLSEPMPFSTVQAIENAKHNTELGRISPSVREPLGAPSDEADLSLLQSELQQVLQHEINLHEVVLRRDEEGLVMSLREFGFFESGSATLKAAAFPTLDHIASVLSVRVCRLRIEGHTDNVPIHTPQISSNWELSTARATELVRLLIVRYRFAPERLAAAGYAEFHPIASNATEQGRAQNRRVDVVILSQRSTRHSTPDELANRMDQDGANPEGTDHTHPASAQRGDIHPNNHLPNATLPNSSKPSPTVPLNPRPESTVGPPNR